MSYLECYIFVITLRLVRNTFNQAFFIFFGKLFCYIIRGFYDIFVTVCIYIHIYIEVSINIAPCSYETSVVAMDNTAVKEWTQCEYYKTPLRQWTTG